MAEPDIATDSAAVPAEPVDGARALLNDLVGLSQEVGELAHDQLQLVALEAKLAARSFMTMIAAAVVIGVLLATAWLALMGAVVWWLDNAGIGPQFGMIAMAVLNLLAALIAYNLIRRRSGSLGFPATLRSLRSALTRQREGASE